MVCATMKRVCENCGRVHASSYVKLCGACYMKERRMLQRDRLPARWRVQVEIKSERRRRLTRIFYAPPSPAGMVRDWLITMELLEVRNIRYYRWDAKDRYWDRLESPSFAYEYNTCNRRYDALN